ncbi:hypothetical protein FKP32DRAFT_1564228 [Trametes sanguinea]|nr:hypothetical protein FKP32DRAFT_1564228 [Trametes sanguinea]
MTPRGVQVWFQNRRAKTKQQVKKAEAAAAAAGPSTSPTEDGDEDAGSGELASNAPNAPRPSEGVPTGEDGTDANPSEDPSSALASTTQWRPRLPSRGQPPRLPRPRPPPLAWSASSPSVSTAPPSASTPASSALGSPSPANHANNSHVRVSTHPPSATSPYSHNHLAPTDIYSQRRTSLPPSLSSSLSGHGMGLSMMSSLRRRGAGGYDPNIRRRSTDMGGHRIVAHPYISVAQSANGAHHHLYADGDDAAHPQQQIRRPMLSQRMTAPFGANMPGSHVVHSPQSLHPHTHSQPILPSQAQRPEARQPYDVSPIPVSLSHSQGYNQPMGNGHGYDIFAPRHSIDGSALGLTHAHAQMSMMHPGSPGMENDGFSMGMGSMPDTSARHYAISQRPMPAPIPGPLPSPNFSFGNPFGPAGANSSSSNSSTSNSASGTPPNVFSPPLLSLRRTSESGVSDGDTEESSGAPLSRFGSIASINGSEASWTSAYPSEGEEGDASASRRLSCASEFLGMFSEMDVGSNGGTPAPHMQEQHQLRHSNSSSHLSPHSYPQGQAHSPDALAAAAQQQQQPQQHQMQGSSDADGYPSPSSASTISAGSNHGNDSSHQHTLSHDTTSAGSASGTNHMQGQAHPRTNTSSELAYALQGDHQVYQQHPQANASKEDNTLQYPVYESQMTDAGDANADESMSYGYAQDQSHHAHREYAKAQIGHFPTVYEGYVYPHNGTDGQIPEEDASAMNDAYAAGAIELTHMCVPASEFMGGYMQYS